MSGRSNKCEETVLNELYFVDRGVREADRMLLMGDRDAARTRYRGAHYILRRTIGTARSCLTAGRIVDQSGVLRHLLDSADGFERLEEMLEGKRG
jgi:hypothetical protein